MLRRYHDFMERHHVQAKHTGSRRFYFDLMMPIFAAAFVVLLAYEQWLSASIFGVCLLGGWAYLHDDPKSFWHDLIARTLGRRRA
jgi:hypothetical protein